MATMEAKPESSGIRPTFTLGDRLRKAREVAGLSIDDMADELGTSTKTVYSYEGDKGARLVARGG